MKTLLKIAVGFIFLASSLCFARLPECDPGPHGCDNKLIVKPLVTVSPFKITDQNGQVHFEVDRRGRVRGEGKTIGWINSKGKFVDTKKKLIASLQGDILVNAKGESLVQIDAIGTIENGSGIPVSWQTDGSLKQGDKVLDVKLLPANSPARRAASIVFFLSTNIVGSTTVELPYGAGNVSEIKALGKPTGACHVSTIAGNVCFPGLTEEGCKKVASNVQGVHEWKQGQGC